MSTPRLFHPLRALAVLSVLLLLCMMCGGMRAGAQTLPAGDDYELNAIELDEVTVTAPMTDIELVGDTTVIHVGAFKTSRGARLEELVAKVPGMRYDRRTGRLFYNGQQLSEININGRKLNLGDIASILETIPVEILGQLKVYDKLTEMEKLRGIPDPSRQKNMVLDLSTRPEFSSMYLSEAKAAQGTERKRQYGADIKRFDRNGHHVIVKGQTGNLQQQSFYRPNRTDEIGGSLQTSYKKLSQISASANYTHGIDGSQSSSGAEEFLLTGSRLSYSAGETVRKSRRLYTHALVTYSPSPTTMMTFLTGYNQIKGTNSGTTQQAAFSGNPGLDFRNPFDPEKYDHVDRSLRLNDMHQQNLTGDDQKIYQANASLRHNFKRGSRSGFDMDASYVSSSGTTDNFSLSRTTYYELRDILGNDSVLLRNQFRRNPTHMRSLSVHFGFNQEIKNVSLGLSYNLQYQRNRNFTSTYDLSPFSSTEPDAPASWLPEGYETAFIDSLSNHTVSNTLSHFMALNIHYYVWETNINAHIGIKPKRQTLDQKTGRATADTVRHSNEYSASLSISRGYHKSRFNLYYNANTRQPELSDLLTLTDNSNPLYITRGNPDLSPSFMQSINVSYEHIDLGISVDSRWSNTVNGVTRATTYDLTTGGIETHPVNINGNWRADNNLRYFRRIGRRISVTSDNSFNLARNVGLINEGGQPEPSRSITRSRVLQSELRADYSPSWGSMNLTLGWTHDYSRNQLRDQRNYVRNYSLGYDIFVDLPADIQLKSDISYSWRNGTYITPGEDDQLLWNLEASWRFLRNRQATLRVQWRDILSRSKNFSRVVTASHISERYSRVIGSYFLATLSYQFQLR